MRALSQQGHGPGDKDVAGYKKEEPQIVVLLFCTVNSESVRQAAENGTDFVRARDIVFFVLYVFPLKWERLIKKQYI